MPLPTLYTKGSLVPINKKSKKEELDNYVPVHYVLNLLRYKLEKEKVNIHDRLFFFNSETGSGKSTAFVIEMFRSMFVKSLSMFPEDVANQKMELRKTIDTDMSIYDFPDDKYTTANRKEGIKLVQRKKNIILCTQPKNLTAEEKAKENASEPFNPDIILGENIGIKSGLTKVHASANDVIIYSTLGNLAEVLKFRSDEEIMAEYAIIMIDECHERSLELDGTILYLRALLWRNAGNPSMPLIVFMSATFDVAKFAKYFGSYYENSILVVGESSNKDIIYLDEPATDYYAAVTAKVMDIHTNIGKDDPENQSAILVFVAGNGEIGKVMKAVQKEDKNKELIIIRVTSEIYKKEKLKVMDEIENLSIGELANLRKQPNGKRRLIIATNVIETGLTVGTLKYLIDTGFEKGTSYAPIHGLPMLRDQPIAKNSATQRYGRVGRKFKGIVYPMYTKEDYDLMADYSPPDIYKSNITKLLLQMHYVGVDASELRKPILEKDYKKFVKYCLPECVDPQNECAFNYIMFENNEVKINSTKELQLNNYPPDMLDNVAQDTFLMSRNTLISLGLYGTYLGYLASKIPRISAETIRMIFAGFCYGVSMNDLVTIGCMIEQKFDDYIISANAARRSRDKQKAFDIIKILKELVKPEVVKDYYLGDIVNMRQIIYDEFIDCLAIIKWVVKTARKEGASAMKKKAESKYGINISGLSYILETRESVIQTLNKLGFYDIYPELDFNSPTILDDICRYKRCFYAGYKNNIAYKNDDGFSYTTLTGIRFTTEIQLRYRPKKIIYSSLFMRAKPGTITYFTASSATSAMDGII